MKFAIAVHGTRGDVEPALAAGLELRQRGHEVRLAVPPNLLGFAKSSGFGEVASYGPDSQSQLEAEVIRLGWKPRNPLRALRQARDYLMQGWMDMSDTLLEMTDGVDAILTGTTYQEIAGNVAEALSLPLAALHYFPFRANTHVLPVPCPFALATLLWAAAEWGHWQLLKPADDEQRRHLGLAPSRTRAAKRLVAQGTLEIQAYDGALFPGLEAQWRGKRPVVGNLTLALETTADAVVRNWIAEGPPPIHFGFGSMRVDAAPQIMSMILEVCHDMGQRALIVSGSTDLAETADPSRVMVVPAVNHSDIFPRCAAIVHHGGAGTTGASTRSGRPTLVLSVTAEQPLWGASIRQLGIGTSRRLSNTTTHSLRADLETVMSASCVAGARELASRMTPPAQSIAATATLLEQLAERQRRC